MPPRPMNRIRNRKLAKPEPKKLKTESWQKNGGKNMELPKLHKNRARFGKDEAKPEIRNKFEHTGRICQTPDVKHQTSNAGWWCSREAEAEGKPTAAAVAMKSNHR